MPVQPGVIRPCGETQTISVMTRPAPPSALPPRWAKWKSVGTPSPFATYMSIGETTTRLARLEAAEAERLEHRGRLGASALGVGANQSSMPATNSGRAREVVVGDPAAAES